VYEALFGFHVFGLGFITSMGFIIGTGGAIFTTLSTAVSIVMLLWTVGVADHCLHPRHFHGYPALMPEIYTSCRCLCVILVGRAAVASGGVDHQEASTCQAHLLCSQAGACPSLHQCLRSHAHFSKIASLDMYHALSLQTNPLMR